LSGRRPISIDIAKKLVQIFNTDIEKVYIINVNNIINYC